MQFCTQNKVKVTRGTPYPWLQRVQGWSKFGSARCMASERRETVQRLGDQTGAWPQNAGRLSSVWVIRQVHGLRTPGDCPASGWSDRCMASERRETVQRLGDQTGAWPQNAGRLSSVWVIRQVHGTPGDCPASGWSDRCMASERRETVQRLGDQTVFDPDCGVGVGMGAVGMGWGWGWLGGGGVHHLLPLHSMYRWTLIPSSWVHSSCRLTNTGSYTRRWPTD